MTMAKDRIVALGRRPSIVHNLWETFRQEVVPPDASSIQVRETRRAFYAGAKMLLGLILTSFAPGTEAEESDLDLMDQIDQELRAFLDDVAAGRA
jgi:hypothetical protein